MNKTASDILVAAIENGDDRVWTVYDYYNEHGSVVVKFVYRDKSLKEV